MRKVDIRSKCRVNSNCEKDTFVGLRCSDGDISINFPIGYHISEDDNELRKDIMLLFTTLSANTKRKESDVLRQGNAFDEMEFPLPKQISPDTPELNSVKLKEFLLRMSLIYSEGFFAKKVMLIEGSSDMILCRYLCNRLNLKLDVAGSQIIPVEGKGQFPVITKLFRLIGKEVCVLTDLDGFTDDNNIVNLFAVLPEAIQIANDYGNRDLQSMIRDIKTKIDELVQSQKENMVMIYNQHPYWVNRDPEADDDKIIRRALIAQLFTVSADELATWPDPHEWTSLKKRITVLFDILEKLGCFILRRGAVESYYAFSPNTTFNGKPSAAANEVSYWEDKSNEQIYAQFSDIVRSLQFAALDKTVDESFAVKKELLSELACVT